MDSFPSTLANLADTLDEHKFLNFAEILEANDLKIFSSTTSIVDKMKIDSSQAQSMARIVGLWKGSPESLARCIRSVAMVRSNVLQRSESVSLVWTGGGRFSLPSRTTLSVAKEMISGSRNHINIFGYVITMGAEPLFDILAEKGDEGVRVRLILDKATEQLLLINKLWKKESGLLEVMELSNVKLHAKLIAVDGVDLLVTSANLTFSGLENNIEIGLRIRGKAAAEVDQFISMLIANHNLNRVR